MLHAVHSYCHCLFLALLDGTCNSLGQLVFFSVVDAGNFSGSSLCNLS